MNSPALEDMVGSDILLPTFDVDDMATEAPLFQIGYLTLTGEDDDGGRTHVTGWTTRTTRSDRGSTEACSRH